MNKITSKLAVLYGVASLLFFMSSQNNYANTNWAKIRETVKNLPNEMPPVITAESTMLFCNGGSIVLTSSISENYQWYRNGQAISEANDQTFAAYENGIYTVTVNFNEDSDGQSSNELLIRQGNVWTGNAADNNWSNPANWSCGTTPLVNDHIIIKETAGFPAITNETVVAIYSLSLTDAAYLKVEGGSTLKVIDAIAIAPTATLAILDKASLVQVNDVENIGAILAQRITTPMKRYDFTYWSAPVSNQTLHSLSPNTLADKYYSFSPVIGNWITHLNGTQVMEEGKGYIVRAPQDFSITVPSVYSSEFKGVPNNGLVEVPIVIGNSDMNLIGNPYPSAIDMDLFLSNPTNAALTNGTIYLWTHNSAPAQIPGDNTYNYTSNDYAAYNLMGGTATATEGNNEKPTGKVASGQCFFIKGLASGQAIFDNSMRIADNNDQFFRMHAAQNLEKHRLWLNLSNNEGAFKQTLLGYAEGATDGIDRNFDGIDFNANAFINFYTISEGQHFTIQGRALPFNPENVAGLGYSTTIAGTFTVALEDFDGLFDAQQVYLYDAVAGVLHDLKANAYEFTTATGTFNNRFELRFVNETLATATFTTGSDLVVAADASQLKIKASEKINSVSLTDLSGKEIYAGHDIGMPEIIINTGVFTQATVVFVKITLQNGSVTIKKILMR